MYEHLSPTLGLINQANHFNVGKQTRPGRIVDEDEDGLWPELVSHHCVHLTIDQPLTRPFIHLTRIDGMPFSNTISTTRRVVTEVPS